MVTKKNHQSRWHSSNYRDPNEALDFGPQPERRLNFLILALPDGHLGTGEIVSVSFREGIDFIDEPWPEFGNFLILETA